MRTRLTKRLFTLAALIAFLILSITASHAAEQSETAYQPTVFITGANRGMGLEFARQYAELGYRVIATARKPAAAEELNSLQENYADLVIEQLDVTDHERIDALAAQYQDQAIDVLINNAGVSGGYDNQVFGEINYEAFNKAIAVNTYAPIKLAETFLPMIQASEQKKIVAISSNLASITNSFGEVYIYRVSKAALNMAYRSMAKDLVDDGMIVTLLTPDPTRTDFAAAAKGASYLKKVPKRPGGITVRTAQESVTDMIRTIDSLTLQDSGTFKGYGGKAIPW